MSPTDMALESKALDMRVKRLMPYRLVGESHVRCLSVCTHALIHNWRLYGKIRSSSSNCTREAWIMNRSNSDLKIYSPEGGKAR